MLSPSDRLIGESLSNPMDDSGVFDGKIRQEFTNDAFSTCSFLTGCDPAGIAAFLFGPLFSKMRSHPFFDVRLFAFFLLRFSIPFEIFISRFFKKPIFVDLKLKKIDLFSFRDVYLYIKLTIHDWNLRIV